LAIKVSLPFNGHRGLKLRFKAFGTSWCPRLNVEQNVVNEMAFQGSNLTQPLYCTYDMKPPLNSTILIQVSGLKLAVPIVYLSFYWSIPFKRYFY